MSRTNSTFHPVQQACSDHAALGRINGKRKALCWDCMKDQPVLGGKFVVKPRAGTRWTSGPQRFRCAACLAERTPPESPQEAASAA